MVDTPITNAYNFLDRCSKDPLELFKDANKSKKEITQLLQATFKSTTKGP